MISEIHGFDSQTIDILKPKQSIHLTESLFQKENNSKPSIHTGNLQARINDFLSLPYNSSQHPVNLPNREKVSRESKSVKFSILSSQLNNQIHY